MLWLNGLPLNGWVTLNIDGVVKKNLGLASVGGLLCDSHGRWVHGFSIGLGITNNITIELKGLLEGLNLAIQLHITHLVVQLDALVVVNLLNSRSYSNILLNPLIFEHRKALESIPHK